MERGYTDLLWIAALGDCGAWIVDRETGVLYGHIIAGQPDGNLVHFVSAPQIKNDIERQIDALVELPNIHFNLRSSLIKHPEQLHVSFNDKHERQSLHLLASDSSATNADTEDGCLGML
jgi:hypothetical protein